MQESFAGTIRVPAHQQHSQRGRDVRAFVRGLEAWLIGGGLSDLEDPAAAFRAVTWEDVLQVAQANLDPEKRAEGVVRGTSLRPPVDD